MFEILPPLISAHLKKFKIKELSFNFPVLKIDTHSLLEEL